MPQSVVLTIFFCLFLAVLVWFVLVSKLFRALEQRHPAKFEELGRPSHFLNNSPKNSFAFVLFLLRREYRTLEGDPAIIRLGDFMFGFFLAYMVVFLFLFFGVPLGYVR